MESALQLRDVLGILRARWRMLLACLLLVLAATALVTYRTQPVYEAHARVFFTSNVRGYTLSSKDLATFTELMGSPLLLDPIREELGLPTDAPISLRGSVSDNAPIIDIYAVSDNGQRAADIANAAGPLLGRVGGKFTTSLAAAGGSITASPIIPAGAPGMPISPNIPRNALVGLLAGLGLGIGVVLLRHFLDSRVRTDADLRSISKRPILGHLRRIRDIEHDRLILESDPHSLASEEFRKLRTNLQFVDVTTGGKHSFVVTSPMASEGKTTVAVNLALAVAQAGTSVLLIDGDLRHPSVADALGLEGGVGLTTVLLGRATPADVIQRYGSTALHVLPAGEIPPNPSELLGADATERLFGGLLDAYDFVIVDSPPVLPVIDPVLINRLVGGMLMVVTVGQTHKRDLVAALKSLETVNSVVAGFALNQIEGGGSYYAYGAADQRYGRSQRGSKKREKKADRKAEKRPAVAKDPVA